MAAFVKFYKLCDQNDLLGLSPDKENGIVINTLSRNIIYRTQINTQKVVQSWSTTHKLSNKVVYDYKTDKYVAVFDRIYLRCWEQDDQDIRNGGKKIKLSRSVEDIFSFDGQHTILLYKDGTCETLENMLNDIRCEDEAIVNDSHQILQIACFRKYDQNIVMTYFVKNPDNENVEFVYYNLNGETFKQIGVGHRIKIERSGSTAKLTGYSVVQASNDIYPNVMTIWSDKKIFMDPIKDDQSLTDLPGNYVATFNSLRADVPLTILSLSVNHIAIYGANEGQEGSSLVLYNTNCHVVQSSQFFKVHLTNCRLWAIDEYILMAFGQVLWCTSFRTCEDRLSNMLGIKRLTEVNSTIYRDINEEIEFEDGLSFDKKLTGSIINKETNGQDISVDILHRSCVDTKVSSHLYSIEEIEMLTSELERRGASEFEITECIIPLLIRAKLSNEIYICLKRYTIISEKMLVRSLKFFLSWNDDSLNKSKFIKQILSCSFHEETIREYLRTYLNIEDVIYVLKFIHHELHDEALDDDRVNQCNNDFDFDTALLNWFTVIIDANYQQFVLSRNTEFIEMIEEWKKQIDLQIKNLREFKAITAKLRNLVESKFASKKQSSSKWYSIELVNLYK